MTLNLPPLPTTRGNVDESCERCEHMRAFSASSIIYGDLDEYRETICKRTGWRTVFERTDENGCGPDARYFKERT